VLRHLDQQGFAGRWFHRRSTDAVIRDAPLAEDLLFLLPPFDRLREGRS
jgi:hypothetical protein